MSKVSRIHLPAPGVRGGRVALLGTGVVGSAVVGRYRQLAGRGMALPPFAWLSNSRLQVANQGSLEDAIATARAAPPRAGSVPPWAEGEALARGDIVIDATVSDAVAGWHSEWLLRGIHVVTANKLGNGGDLSRAQAIIEAQHEGACYGDSATVGAGLPLLATIRGLVAGGDRIHAVEGVLSGSLGWLLSHFDDTRRFSDLVREARDKGYTEPDPRQDLSGEDVRRKLLILARASGLMLEPGDIRVSSLLPDALRDAPADAVDAQLDTLDAPLRERFLNARRGDARLCFVGRFDADGDAAVGLRALPLSSPLAGGGGTDNRVAIFSDRYPDRPLLVQGPGAGAHVTAAALLDDVLRIARSAHRA